MAVGNFESWKRTTLSQPVAPWDTTIYLASVPTVTSGRLYLKNQAQEEWIDFTGVSGSTVTGCSRGMSQTQDPSTSGTWLTWIAGTEVRLVAMHDQLANKQKTNTWAAAQTFSAVTTFNAWVAIAGTSSYLDLPSLTTAQRNALTPNNGFLVYDSDLWENYQYVSGAWSAVSAWSTQPNASTTVAGKVEIATSAEAIWGATTWGTGAAVVADPATNLIVWAYFWLSNTLYNLTIVPSRAAWAETIALKTKAGTDPSATDPIYIGFRNVTAWTWDFTYLSITAATSVVIPSTATMWASNSVPFRLWLVWFNDGWVFRLWIVNTQTTSGIMALDDDLLLSSTTIGTGSDSAWVVYSDAWVTTKWMRLIGYLDYTLATAGTRDTAPSKIQIFWPWVKKPWDIVQAVVTQTGAATTGTTVMPYNDSIPQNTQWDEYMTLAITPTSTINKLIISSDCCISSSSSTTLCAALFQDSTASALSSKVWWGSATTVVNMSITHEMRAATTSSTTFKIRAGGGWAAATTFNGASWARLHGWVLNSFIKITEIMV